MNPVPLAVFEEHAQSRTAMLGRSDACELAEVHLAPVVNPSAKVPIGGRDVLDIGRPVVRIVAADVVVGHVGGLETVALALPAARRSAHVATKVAASLPM